jgi:hypothetical protein
VSPVTRPMRAFNELRQQRRMAWMVPQRGWVAVPEEVVDAFSTEGFEECARKPTASRLHQPPADSLWQGVHPRVGSAASVSWVNRPARHYTLVFIEVDGESLTGGESVRREPGRPSGRAGHDPGTTSHGVTTGHQGQPDIVQAARPRSEARAITS